AVRLRAKLHGVENAAAVGLDEIKRLARAVECEIKLRLRERNKARWADDRAIGNDKFIGRRIVGQNAAGNVHAVRGVIVKFDELWNGGIFRMWQNLVDDHIA